MSTTPETPTYEALPLIPLEQLRKRQQELRERMVPGDCYACEMRETTGEPVQWECSECGADYCAPHKDSDCHQMLSERHFGCDGHPVPWKPWERVVEELSIVEELIRYREASAQEPTPAPLTTGI